MAHIFVITPCTTTEGAKQPLRNFWGVHVQHTDNGIVVVLCRDTSNVCGFTREVLTVLIASIETRVEAKRNCRITVEGSRTSACK